MLVPQLTRPQFQLNAEQSNQMASCHSPPPVSVPHNDSWQCPAINLNLILSKESTAERMLVLQSTRQWSQFNAEQSNQIAIIKSNGKMSLFPPVFVPCNNSWRSLAINLNLVLSKESSAAKDVGTTVDKTTIPVSHWAMKSNRNNQIKLQDVFLAPVSVTRKDSRRCPAINLILVLSKESTASKDVGTTVDKTTIPV